MGGREWLQLLVLSLLWGGSFFFVGVAVKALPPFTIVALRVTVAALILWLVIASLKIKVNSSPRVWGAFVTMGILNNVIPFCLIVWGQVHVPSGLASILNATTPLFTVIIAGIFLKDERMTWNKLVGITIGFIGVVVLLGLELLQELSITTVSQFFILIAAMIYGFAGVYGRRFKKMQVEPLFTAAGQLTASSIIMIPLALTQDGWLHLDRLTPNVWMSILGLAALSTAVAYIIYFQILSTAGATNLLLVTFLIPVSAILLGYFFLEERLLANHLIGMLVIGFGLVAIDGRVLKKSKNRR